MKLINHTDYPTAEVKKLVAFGTKGLDGMKGLKVEILPGRKHSKGKAYWGYKAELITIWLSPSESFPKVGYKRHRSSPLSHDWQDWREALVALAAHEGRHIDLWFSGYDDLDRGNSQQVEMACEAYEHKRLTDYRKLLG